MATAVGEHSAYVIAQDSTGAKTDSPKSNVVSYTITALAAPVLSVAGRKVSWTEIAEADHYNVYVDDGDAVVVDGTKSEYVVPLGNSVAHKVKVAACDSYGNEGAKSAEVDETATAVTGTSWDWTNSATFGDWDEENGKKTHDSDDSVITPRGEGLDIYQNLGAIATVLTIGDTNKIMTLDARLYGGQEGDNTQGAEIKVTVNGEVIKALGSSEDYITLPLADSNILGIYDLSAYATKTVVVRVAQVYEQAYHCVIRGIKTGEFTDVVSGAVQHFYWGHDYTSNWGGEQGNSNDHKFPLVSDAFAGAGTIDDYNEGLDIDSWAMIGKKVAITADNAIMMLSTRDFDNADYKGAVAIDGTLVKAVGDSEAVWSMHNFSGYSETVGDGCQNAILKMYDLSEYIGKTVFLTISNVGDQKFVLGGLSFSGIWSAAKTWDATTLNDGHEEDNLDVNLGGDACVYNEGVNFRTQDFAGGFGKAIDLTAVSGKKVTLTASMRSFGGDDAATLEIYINGVKQATTATYPEKSETVVDYPLDLSALQGTKAYVFVRIPSRNYRIVLTQAALAIADA
jgi:hypothetical protein